MNITDAIRWACRASSSPLSPMRLLPTGSHGVENQQRCMLAFGRFVYPPVDEAIWKPVASENAALAEHGTGRRCGGERNDARG